MRKFLYSVLMLAAVVLAACSNDDNGDTQPKRGMILNASVENLSSRATMTDESGTWKFAFTENDQVSVSNNKISSCYTFTNNGSQFTCAQAEATKEAADWYAYFPGNEVDLTNQTGNFADVANKFAVAGKTAEATTGEKGLSITLKSKVAVLRIVKVDNYGPCDIYLKTADGKYVKGLKAKKNDAGFDVETSDTKVSVFNKEDNGKADIYYVIVPAGVKIEVWNDTKRINTTKAAGLTAGKYYTLTSGPTTGTATYTLEDGTTETVGWVQLWIGGPRISVKNASDKMNFEDARKTGDKYVWGKNWRTPSLDEVGVISNNSMPNTDILDATYEYNNTHGFKLKGKQPGYTKNTVFFTGNDTSNKDYVEGKFWLTDEKENGYGTTMNFLGSSEGLYQLYPFTKDHTYSTYEVRPVLTINTVLWGEQDIK